eukprot:SAG31_NODE_3660_length_4013_cov_3.345938_1_plen_323_part_00
MPENGTSSSNAVAETAPPFAPAGPDLPASGTIRPPKLDTSRALVLQPGLVLLKQALPLATQEEFASLAFRRGQKGEVVGRAKGFQTWWAEPNEQVGPSRAAVMTDPHLEAGSSTGVPVEPSVLRLNVARKNAGRVYDAIATFPGGREVFAPAVSALHAAARSADPEYLGALPAIEHTHLQLWNYQPKKGLRIAWHADNWWSDGSGQHAVLSLSIGAACDFLYKPPPLPHCTTASGTENLCVNKKQRQLDAECPQLIRLESGDCLVFGGPCRYMEHAVKRIHAPTTAPASMRSAHGAYPLCGGRLNFTFRYAPEALGREGEYK